MRRKFAYYWFFMLPVVFTGWFWVIPTLINAASTAMNMAGFAMILGLFGWSFYEVCLPIKLNNRRQAQLRARQVYDRHVQDEESQLRRQLMEKS